MVLHSILKATVLAAKVKNKRDGKAAAKNQQQQTNQILQQQQQILEQQNQQLAFQQQQYVQHQPLGMQHAVQQHQQCQPQQVATLPQQSIQHQQQPMMTQPMVMTQQPMVMTQQPMVMTKPMVMTQQLPPLKLDKKEQFSSSWFDCCADPCVCCCVSIPCCFPVMALCYSHKVSITDTHGICNFCKSGCATVCLPCGIVCCYKDIFPCFATSLLKRGMEKHEIDQAPSPCGDSGCCGCWNQILFCAPCTLCMLYREAKNFPVSDA